MKMKILSNIHLNKYSAEKFDSIMPDFLVLHSLDRFQSLIFIQIFFLFILFLNWKAIQKKCLLSLKVNRKGKEGIPYVFVKQYSNEQSTRFDIKIQIVC